jgi:hypothetical protein
MRITVSIDSFLDFVYHPIFYKQHYDLGTASAPVFRWLGPLEGANPNQ